VISSGYRQVLAVLRTTATGMRAEDARRGLDIEALARHVEGARAKLKRPVSRETVIETRPGIFTLNQKRT
jgi:hypothetical protein